ncbi:protein phosphatase 2A structural subunit [Martiniozyma asiatica (nom. inval.)]|nr:protein phosphatase 2A structural subunit [Martiniozyma asiatica]
MATEELYPIALLMDELRHDDVASRVQAMQRLDTIAVALGPERVRLELLPFLDDVVPEDEDEVIAVAAEELGQFVPLIGGKEHAGLLLPVLEKVAACEEPVVREKAVSALCSISQELDDNQIVELIVPLVQRLAKERWFSLHIAATGLFKAVIARVNSDERKELTTLYADLVNDDSPMVRKAAAKELPELISILGAKFNTPETINELNWNAVLSMYENLVNDNQDSVKFLAVNVLISILDFLKSLDEKSENEKLFASLITLVTDPSWRVRYMVADKFELLIKGFNEEQYTLKLVTNFLALMKDNEAEVRKAISKQLTGFSKFVNKSDPSIVLSQIVPIVSQLSMDESETVRAALASEVTGLAPILGKQDTIDNLLPIFVEMLKDEFSDVRLNIISNLQIVNEVIGIQLLSESLMPAITALANDKLWRVRLAIIEQIPLLAEQLGISFFDETLGQLCMEWLWDPVYSIREAAVQNLQKLSGFFGEEWCQREIIQKLIAKRQTKDFENFICRLTCLFSMTSLVAVVDTQFIEKEILPFVESLADDKVPNIRFNVAKSLKIIGEKIGQEKVEAVLVTLREDEDKDVRYFAQ